jgi:hypothetical protein
MELMTNKRHRRIAERLRWICSGPFNIRALTPDVEIPDGVGAALGAAVKRSKQVPTGHEHPAGGSALNPIASDYWYIGVFGSVWLDVQVGDQIYRVAFKDDTEFVAYPAETRFVQVQ